VIPSPPAHLNPNALIAWGTLSVKLDRLRLLTEVDDWALEQLCENYLEIVELRADVRANGRFQKVTRKGGDAETPGDVMERTRPAYAMLADAERRFATKLAEFGLTPSSRSRVTTTPDADADHDPAKAYFG
jgi:P27 family predicted phage terminase small subunit